MRVERLRRRADFKAAAKGERVRRGPFTVQRRARAPGEDAPDVPRIGFTVTKKIGNAVVRNRIKRRLRAAAAALADEFAASTDYVIVARREALGAPFEQLVGELRSALAARAKDRSATARSGRPLPAARHETRAANPPESAS